MFNIGTMSIGEKIKAILESKNMRLADLIRRMIEIDPELDESRLQGAVRLLIVRGSTSSKYLPMVAKALNLTVDQLLNSDLKQAHAAKQTTQGLYDRWPFSDRITYEEYNSLTIEQKEIIISRIRTFLDDNNLKSKGSNTQRKATN